MARTKKPQKNNTASQISTAAKRPLQGDKRKSGIIINPSELIPSGSTMLNLACSDSVKGAFGLGKIVTMPGSSSSSKTLLVLTMLAELARLKRFNNYYLVYDDVERALEFNIAYLFGNTTNERIQDPPNKVSNTIQDFKRNILALSKKRLPFIYALDSFDSLTSDEELEKEMRKALAAAKSEEAAKKIAGSYGTEKAKIAGQTLRMITEELEKTQSTLIIIQQLRQKMNAAPFSRPYTTSGGEAPFFYSAHQVWLTKLSGVKSKGQIIGNDVKAEVTKNKINGKLRNIEFRAYYDYGIDDIGSCVSFLVDEGRWSKKGNTIEAGDDLPGISGNKTMVIKQIEEQGLETQVQKTVQQEWLEREESLKLNRKPRFK